MVKKMTARKRLQQKFEGPFISRMWHADGSPFTNAEYKAAGVKPPTRAQQKKFAEAENPYGAASGVSSRASIGS